jgi:cytochrome c oxidase subunit I
VSYAADTPLDLAIVARPTASSAMDYLLVVPAGAQRTLARAWLWLGMLALVGAGLFSIILVLSRTPGMDSWFPVSNFFRVALVVHVDLSVLVWFVALAGMLWSVNGSERGVVVAWIALGLCAAGAAIMSVAPFFGTGEAIMANYIPVLDDPRFLAGLLVFATGVVLLVLRGLVTAPRLGVTFDGSGALNFGLNASVIATAVALLAFGWSFALVPQGLTGKAYYELLFWGGGHALQFTWTLLMLVAWLWLASASGARTPLSPRITLLMFALALAAVFVTPFAYLAHDIASVEHRDMHTWAMRLGGGAAILPIALAVVIGVATAPARAGTGALRVALVTSVVVFASGGFIGVFITGNNVMIPAHYHGSIVGVTLALMGLVYHLLPQLGYRTPGRRLAALQPAVYGAGQLMHISGLVLSGGYGVKRKVAGAEQVLSTSGEIIGMGLMGLGGLVAIAGGILFIIVVGGSLTHPAGSPRNTRNRL